MTVKELKAIRKKAGKTQRQVAQEIGVSRRTVESWESGARTMRDSTAKLIRMMYND